MQAFRLTIAIAALAASPVSLAAQVGGLVVSHHEELQDLDFAANGGAGRQKLSAPASAVLKFTALGRIFELQLESNDRLFGNNAGELRSRGIAVYRGKVAGNAGSWVRLVMHDGEPRGLIWDGSELLAIEAPDDSAAGAPVIFRLADTYFMPGTFSCGVADGPTNGVAMYKSLIGELGIAISRAPGAVSQLDIGTIGDFEFTSGVAGDPATEIATRINSVDGIFSAQLGVQMVIQEMEVFTTSSDPFGSSTDPVDLLTELGLYRAGNANQRAQGLTHLFTGRDLDGSTVGFAYGDSLCLNQFGAGLTQGTNGALTDSLVAAHEIGHNFGAPHDGDPNGACDTEVPGFLMEPTINGSNQFSPCSITVMQPSIAAASCIFPLPTVDVTVALNGTPPSPLLGNSATLNFDAISAGTQQATNVMLDLTLPNNVTFVSAAATAGSCTSGAGIVNCQLGAMNGGTTTTVTVSTIASAAGAGTFDAVVTADVDDVPGNNQASVQVTVIPAVDLVINTPAAAQISLDQSTTVTVAVENTAVLDATGVALAVTLPAGLQADSASWTIGNCTVAAQQVDCQANSFTNQSTASVTLGVTGTATGQHDYAVTLTSAESDRDPSDNSINGTVTVNAPGGGGNDNEDSGSGASGAALLCLLLSVLARRRIVHA